MKTNDQIEALVVEAQRAIALRRAELGLSLRHLSLMTGMSSAGISRIENGERSPNLRTLLVLSEQLGLTITISRGEVTVT